MSTVNRRARKPWPLPKLLGQNRCAITVYAALRWLSGDVRRLETTRDRITEVCGLHRDTISAAMKVLDKAGWVRLNYGRAGTRTWYRLSFPVQAFFPETGPSGHRKAKFAPFPGAVGTGSRREGGNGQNRSQEARSCGGSNRLPPPLRGEAVLQPPPSRLRRAGADHLGNPPPRPGLPHTNLMATPVITTR